MPKDDLISYLQLKGLNTRVIIFPIEQWKGVKV